MSSQLPDDRNCDKVVSSLNLKPSTCIRFCGSNLFSNIFTDIPDTVYLGSHLKQVNSTVKPQKTELKIIYFDVDSSCGPLMAQW